jgi:hypothetical protein
MYYNLTGMQVRYENFTLPNRLVITFDSLSTAGSDLNRVSVQVVLYENGNILMQYRNILGIPGYR